MKEKELLSENGKLHYPGKDKDGWNMVHADTLELAVLALARIMCANIHSQNGTAILAQELLSRK